MHRYCTYFDRHYLLRGLAMVSSLRRHDPTALLMALCLDQDSEAVLRRLALPGLTPVPLKELEAYDPDLARAKTERDRLEYYFTLSPAINLFALDAEPTGDGVTYLDADLFFFGNPQPLFDEMGDQSVTIIEHGLPARRAGLAAMFGVYNVGWLSFRNDPRARVCLRWWREQCLAACDQEKKAGRFADQKYLDEWPRRFEGVKILKHKGANVAPWNLGARRVTREGGQVLVDGEPLIFFHFQRTRRVVGNVYDPNLAPYGAKMTPSIRRGIFEPYIRAIAAERARSSPFLSEPSGFDLGLRQRWPGAVPWLKQTVRAGQKLLNGDYFRYRV